jgi:hypothetical protein
MFHNKCQKTGRGLMTEGKGAPGDPKHRPQGEQTVSEIHVHEQARLKKLVKFVKNDEDGKQFPEIRKHGDPELFETFVNMCLVHLKPVTEWRMKIYTTHISNFVTASDEAFAMLLLENRVDDYHKSLNCEDGNGAQLLELNEVQPRYTRTESSKQDTRQIGWSRKGIGRFNDLVKRVTKIRKDDVSMQRESEIQCSYAALCGIAMADMGDYESENDDNEDEDSIDGYDGFEGEIAEETEETTNDGEDNNVAGLDIGEQQQV